MAYSSPIRRIVVILLNFLIIVWHAMHRVGAKPNIKETGRMGHRVLLFGSMLG
jgi:fumarate reductase subunit D